MHGAADIHRKALRLFSLSGVLLVVAACSDISPQPLAMVAAQPKTHAQRNLTPFYPALQCMDGLFLKAGRPTVLLSSNQIPDRTRRISVDARSMIITAMSHMTRRSKAFQFVEQGIHKRSSGDILELERDKDEDDNLPQPVLYFSGSISQLDNDTRGHSTEYQRQFDGDDVEDFLRADIRNGLSNSIVTLDLHLVKFPSRIVVPGSAISNSMVVSERSWQAGFAGVISQRTLGLELRVDSVESQGQAVRNLIELGLIEMLGSYANVPFWECLSDPNVDAIELAQSERFHTRSQQAAGPSPARIKRAQRALAALGYEQVQVSGELDTETRQALSQLQAKQGLLVNGTLDFDTYRVLEKVTIPTPSKKPATPQKMHPLPTRTEQSRERSDGFQSFGSFVSDDL